MVTTRTHAGAGLARCTIGPATIGLDLGRVIGIERADRLRPGGDGIVGTVTNRAGEWPVFNLADLLGMVHMPNGRTGQVVLVSSGGERFGLFVDRVTAVGRDENPTMSTVPEAAAGRGLFLGTAILADGPLLILDPDRLFAPPEVAAPRKATPVRKRRTPSNADRMIVFGLTTCPGSDRILGFGLPAGCIAEIVEPGPGSVAAGAAEHIREVVLWHGKPVAVVDVAAWVGLGPTATDLRRILIVRPAGGEPVGLLAGRGVKVLALPLPHMPTRRELALTPGRAGTVIDLNDLTLVVPDLRKLLG